MSRFLDEMARSSHDRLAAARSVATLEVQRRRAEMVPTRPLGPGFHVFAEVKPVSPAEGELGSGGLTERAVAYAEGGATAISVLTEPTRFGGSMELLGEVADRVALPVMRKDFVVDPYQVWEARAHGASGVLAITRMLDDATLQSVVAAAGDAGMFALLEVFDRDDLSRISELEATDRVLVGVNSRDLDTLEVRPGAHEELAGDLPDGLPSIAESGITGPGRVRELAAVGYDGVLVGTALMRSQDPASAVEAILAAGSGA